MNSPGFSPVACEIPGRVFWLWTIVVIIRICPWPFGHELCLANAWRPPLESSEKGWFRRGFTTSHAQR